MKKAIFPGSFDPFHEGHKYVLDEALKIYDFVYIVISWNENKKRKHNFWISKFKIKKILKKYKNVKILINKNELTTNIAKKLKCYDLIRGIRNDKDFLYEKDLERKYKQYEPNINIIYFKSKKNLKNISSSNINKK